MLHMRSWRAVAAVFVALCAAMLLAGRSDATSIRVSLTELSARSQLVVRGRVERLESAWAADRTIETTVYVRLSDVARGHLSTGALIPVRVRGGRVNDVAMLSSEEPVFQPGEEVYLFLEGLSGNAYRVAAGRQGKFEVAGDRATNCAWGTEFKLDELQIGVRQGQWPAEPGALAATAAGNSPDSYVLSGQHWPSAHPSYVVNINTGDAGGGNGSADTFRNAINAAANTWNNAGANFAFQYGGGSGVTSSGQDGKNVVHWENMGNSTTLAESTWWYNGDQIVEADLRFNDYYTWDATGAPSSNEVDLQSVATHEFGHWLSLGHDTDPKCPNASPIMCASYNLGTLKRSLGANDIAGIKALYGSAQVQPTNTPRPTNTPTPRPTATRMPTRGPTLALWQIRDRNWLPLIWR